MKKIVLTLIISLVTFLANAQTAKPTKEQTIEYILNSLKSYKTAKIINMGGDPNTSINWEINEIFFSDCFVSITMTVQIKIPSAPHYGSITKSVLSFNLKDIEQVEFSTNDYGMSGLIFRCLNEAKQINLKETINGDISNKTVSSVSVLPLRKINSFKPSITSANYAVHQSQ